MENDIDNGCIFSVLEFIASFLQHEATIFTIALINPFCQQILHHHRLVIHFKFSSSFSCLHKHYRLKRRIRSKSHFSLVSDLCVALCAVPASLNTLF